MSSRIDLPERDLVVVTIVENVAEVRIERVDVVDTRELLEDTAELLVECCLRILHLPHVEVANPGDLELRVDLCWRLALCLRQHNIDQGFCVLDLRPSGPAPQHSHRQRETLSSTGNAL